MMRNFFVGLFFGVALCLVLHFWVFNPQNQTTQVTHDEKETHMYGERVGLTVWVENPENMDSEIKNAIFDFGDHAGQCLNEAVTQAEKIGDKTPIYILHQWMERNTEEAIKWEMRLRGKPPYPIFKE